MTDAIERVFSNEDRIFEALNEARKLFGSRSTTEDQYDAMKKTLGFCLLYCPERLRDIVVSTLDEAAKREWFFVLYVWPKPSA